MTTEVNCHIYYSISGDAFNLPDLEVDTIAHTPTILNIYTRDEVEVPNVTAVQQVAEVVTELSVPYPIKKGQFFNSESCCLFLNNAGQVLKVNGQYLFRITMMRDGSDHERLHIKFNQPYFPGRHQWDDVAGQAQPNAPPVTL